MKERLNYINILNYICNYYGIDEEKFIELLKERDNKYILLLLLKNNNCLEPEKIQEILKLKTLRSINSNLRLAEEKLLINRFFRQKYFELEDNVDKNSRINL